MPKLYPHIELNTILQPASILIEAAITILGATIGYQKKKIYGWAIAFTFGIYVIYDLTRYAGWDISGNLLAAIFFVTTLSILYAMWSIYQDA